MWTYHNDYVLDVFLFDVLRNSLYRPGLERDWTDVLRHWCGRFVTHDGVPDAPAARLGVPISTSSAYVDEMGEQ